MVLCSFQRREIRLYFQYTLIFVSLGSISAVSGVSAGSFSRTAAGNLAYVSCAPDVYYFILGHKLI